VELFFVQKREFSLDQNEGGRSWYGKIFNILRAFGALDYTVPEYDSNPRGKSRSEKKAMRSSKMERPSARRESL
jgi:hypothetical protein